MNAIDEKEWKDELGIMGFGYYDNSNQTSTKLQYAKVNKINSKKKNPPNSNWMEFSECYVFTSS